MLNEEQLKVTHRALDYLLAHADLSESEASAGRQAYEVLGSLIVGNVIASYWTIDDVQSLQEDGAERITDEQARQVLRRADLHHDAAIGINWDVLQEHLNKVREAGSF